MKKFFKKHKILFTSISAVLLTIALAVVLAFAFADSIKVVFGDDSYINGNYIVEDSNISSVIATPIESEPTEPVIPLVITSPSNTGASISDSQLAIKGTSDPKKILLLNGKEVERLESGEFSVDVQLTPGENTFTFEHNNETLIYTVHYNFTVIKAYAPYEKQTYEAGSSFVAVACARVNSSSVTATFNGETINLSPQPYEEGEEFTNFVGSFSLPTGNETDLNLGGVKFTGSCNGVVRSYTSPSITCLRDKALDKPQIVEIVASQAETFNGDTTDDWSRPTNSYLPEGTLDYRVGGIMYDAESENNYYTLRCGQRVYITKKNAPDPERVTVSKSYEGELPEYNEIALAANEVDSKHSRLVFDTAWRAPFAVDIGPQNYTNPADQDYSVTDITFSYVDIKFFYTQAIDGDFSFDNHPLFSSAQILSADDGYILRLHLHKTGAFYGWNATYNADGQLVFEFLNPHTVKAKDDLTGIKIVLDVGHGGRDIGAEGLRPDTMPEAERNLSLAFKVKAELESYGATVIMDRTSDVALTADERCEFLREQAPDLCISIHHDSNKSASANGGSFFCFNAFSNTATQCVFDRNLQANFYNITEKGWHYFYLARVSSCPVVLTENGFISNLQDFVGISDENTNLQKAKAITAGVLDYFNAFVK